MTPALAAVPDRCRLRACLSSGIALDVGAQLRDRAEPHRPVRKLGLDRAVGVERIGHSVDHAGLEDRDRLRGLVDRSGRRRSGPRPAAAAWAVGLARRLRIAARRRAARPWRGWPSAGQNASKFSLACRTCRRLGAEQEIQARCLERLDRRGVPGGAPGGCGAAFGSGRRLGGGRTRPGPGSAASVRRQRRLVRISASELVGFGPVRARNARPQPLDGGGRHLDRRGPAGRGSAAARLARRAPPVAAAGRPADGAGGADGEPAAVAVTAGRAGDRRRRGGDRRLRRSAAAAWRACRVAGRVRKASPRRLSSLDHGRKANQDEATDQRRVPAMISVVPRLNSLIGIPNPIVAMPAPATRIPSINKIRDIRYAPANRPPPQQRPLLWLPKNFDPLPARSAMTKCDTAQAKSDLD